MLLILKWMKQSTRTTGVVQSLDASEGTSSLSKSHSPRWTSTKPYLHSSTSVLSGGCFFHGLLFHFVAYLCMRAAYPPAWTPVDVTSDFDFDRWEQSDIWNLTVVFGLGSVERNIITFLYLSVSDRAQLRATCFAFAVEITDCYEDLAEILEIQHG